MKNNQSGLNRRSKIDAKIKSDPEAFEPSQRRLLDMLIGWANYVDNTDCLPEDEKNSEVDSILEFYSEVGAIEDMSKVDVKEFVSAKVIELLLK